MGAYVFYPKLLALLGIRLRKQSNTVGGDANFRKHRTPLLYHDPEMVTDPRVSACPLLV